MREDRPAGDSRGRVLDGELIGEGTGDLFRADAKGNRMIEMGQR